MIHDMTNSARRSPPYVIALFIFACLNSAFADESFGPIHLWPNGAPGERGNIGEEGERPAKPDAKKKIIIWENVSAPTITVHKPAEDIDTGAAVVVCPGGGYNILALDLEGTEVVEWLNSIGVTGVLLKYRVGRREGRAKHAAPLEDAQRAMGIVRQHAKTWGIDPKRIGIMGFSAGGHLTAAASNNFTRRAYSHVDHNDAVDCRPDFAMLIYPAYLTLEKEDNKIAPELPVSSKTPPTIIIMTEDDGVRVENALFYYLALKQAKVPAEMHLYAKGGHGYGLRPSELEVSNWPKRCETWMRGLGVLNK